MPDGGVTLVELLVTITIVAILLTVGTAGFTRLIAESRMATAVNSFVTDLHLARSESIKRGVDVTVCAGTGDGIQTCAAGAYQWGTAYLIVADTGGTREQVLRVRSGSTRLTIAATSSALTYHPDGSADPVQFGFSDVGGQAHCRLVTVFAIGYVTTERGDTSVCR